MSDKDSPLAAPGLRRVDPPRAADERTMLTSWLDWHRATVHTTCAGLSHEQAAAAPLTASPLTSVGAVVSRLRWLEHAWFEVVLLGRPDEGRAAPHGPGAGRHGDGEVPLGRLLEEYGAQCARSREITARLELGSGSRRAHRTEGHTTLRWVLVHMVGETARYNGRLDVLRELADGTAID
jgi:hypothetical protein